MSPTPEDWLAIPRSLRLLWYALAPIVLLLTAPMAAGSDSSSDHEDEGFGTVLVDVKYRTPEEPIPLAGVEVGIFWEGGADYACTTGNGKAILDEVLAGVDLILATGPSVALDCPNGDFLNPDNGDEMSAVFWLKNHGVYQWDTFHIHANVPEPQKFLKVKTPKNQNRMCGGMKATWVGTAADDVVTGGPGTDILNGRGGRDTLDGAGGTDWICGGKVGDVLLGGDGDDWIWGEQGSDDIDGGPGNDYVDGGPKNDHCFAETILNCE